MAKVNFEKAKEMYPSVNYGEEEWMAYFRLPAGNAAMAKILYDMLDEQLAAEEREAGFRRIGRRPSREAMPWADVQRRLFPAEFSNESYVEVIRRFWPKGKTQRQFVEKLPMTQSSLSRIMSGTWKPSRIDLEVIAEGLEIQPAVFREWRAMYLSEAVMAFCTQYPNQSIAAVKQIRRTPGAPR